MMKHTRLPRVLGIAAAVLVPPLAIAQTLTTFQPYTTLSAGSLNANFEALQNRIQELEDRLDREGLVKERVYELATDPPVELSEGAQESATAMCEDADDVLLDCSCSVAGSPEGAVGGSSLAVNMRRHMSRLSHSDSEPRSSCICGGSNTAASDPTERYIVAKATCLRVQ